MISALTVAVSLAALLVFPLYFLRSFAYAGIAVVLLAMVGAIVTLPALLAVVGHRIDALPGPAPAQAADRGGRFWYRTATRVMRHPVPVAIAVVAVLLLLGVTVPPGAVRHARRSGAAGVGALAGGRRRSCAPTSRATSRASPSWSPARRRRRRRPRRRGRAVSALAGVARVETSAGTFVGGALDRDGRGRCRPHAGSGSGWMSVVPTFAMASSDGERLVGDIRSLDPDDVDVLVGGPAAELVDTKASIAERLPLAIGLIVVATFVLLFLLTGSVILPMQGARAQHAQPDGHVRRDGVDLPGRPPRPGLLGFTATGPIDTSMPILMFCIAFGLSMDYEVFLLSRIKEEHDRTGDNDHAVAIGLERTGRIVTAAALLLAVTFFAFGTSGSASSRCSASASASPC